ncbi:hypothetical protein RchiOBHm_Chr2g0152851 [Rosa chinensis]|uniref:Uncharacterized protein n=1 Tax=Rosa chinensis TaxID=74649 RepID=A0A2P6S0H8_ROSCH|nr:hypothetical protein RchiOBHm_Chr2g0152851 [Rosa chinensis]
MFILRKYENKKITQKAPRFPENRETVPFLTRGTSYVPMFRPAARLRDVVVGRVGLESQSAGEGLKRSTGLDEKDRLWSFQYVIAEIGKPPATANLGQQICLWPLSWRPWGGRLAHSRLQSGSVCTLTLLRMAIRQRLLSVLLYLSVSTALIGRLRPSAATRTDCVVFRPLVPAEIQWHRGLLVAVPPLRLETCPAQHRSGAWHWSWASPGRWTCPESWAYLQSLGLC